jgi:hypothetical protein
MECNFDSNMTCVLQAYEPIDDLKEITNYYVWIPASVVGTLPAPRFMVCFT